MNLTDVDSEVVLPGRDEAAQGTGERLLPQMYLCRMTLQFLVSHRAGIKSKVVRTTLLRVIHSIVGVTFYLNVHSLHLNGFSFR